MKSRKVPTVVGVQWIQGSGARGEAGGVQDLDYWRVLQELPAQPLLPM